MELDLYSCRCAKCLHKKHSSPSYPEGYSVVSIAEPVSVTSLLLTHRISFDMTVPVFFLTIIRNILEFRGVRDALK